MTGLRIRARLRLSVGAASVATCLVLGAVTVAALDAGPAAAAPACAASQADLANAASMARRCGVRVEAANQTSETTQIFVNPDGSRTLEEHVVPVRLRRGSGWVAVDHTLRRGTDGRVAPVASVSDVSFSGGGTGPLATLRDGRGHTMSLSWPAPLPVPALDGDTATYPDVFPGVDLRVQASDDGFRHVLVVKTRAATQDPRVRTVHYGLSGTGVSFRGTAEGGLEVVDPSGVALASGQPGTAWDSSQTTPAGVAGLAPAATGRAPSDGDRGVSAAAGALSSTSGPGDFARVRPVGVRVSAGALDVVAPVALLDDPATALPMYIDPPFTGGRLSWAYADSGNYTNADGKAWVGLNPADGYNYRSFFILNMAQVDGTQIVSARFDITMVHSWACQATPVSLWWTGPIPYGLGGSRVGWSPYMGLGLDTQSGNAHKISGGVAVCANDPQPDMAMHFNGALTGKVQDWANGGVTSVTFGLCACDTNGANEGVQSRWKKFNADTVQLSVTYNNLPGVPTALDISPCYHACGSVAYAGSTTPTLGATVSDVDGDVLQVNFEVWNTTGTRLANGSVTSTNGAHPQWKVTTALPDDGTEYAFRVQACDNVQSSNPCGGWTGWFYFYTQAHPPTAPSVSGTPYVAGGWNGGIGIPGTFTFGPNGAANIYEYVYAFDSGSPVTVPASGSGQTASVTWTPPVDGAHTLSVQSRDIAGNTSPPAATYQFNVTPPAPDTAYFPLDEGSGTVAHNAIDSTNNGTLTGDAHWAASGHLGGAVTTNGQGTVKTARPVLSTVNAAGYTVAAWVRVSTTAIPANDMTAVSQDGQVRSSFELAYGGNSSGPGSWCFAEKDADTTTAGSYSVCAAGQATFGEWVHLAGVYDAVNHQIRLYVNGNLIGSTWFNGTWSASGSFEIGQAMWGGNPTSGWIGDIDEVHAYQRVLSDDEIFQLSIQ